jgi:undecaprenyl-diphosphatase
MPQRQIAVEPYLTLLAELDSIHNPSRDAQPLLSKLQAQSWIRILFYLLGSAIAIRLLLPRVGELREIGFALRTVRWEWLTAGLFVVPSTYLAAAMALRGAVNHPLPLARTVLVQLAGSFANKLTPKGFGGIGVNGYYLQRLGVPRTVAITGIALNMAAGMVVHMLSLVATSASLGLDGTIPVHLPEYWPLLVACVALIILLGLILLRRLPNIRYKFVTSVATAAEGLLNVLRTPTRALELFIGVAGVTAVNVLTLTITLHAVGAPTPLIKVGAAYLGGAALASASPTPGNLGAIEVVLVADLASLGVQTTPAMAGVLLYRLLGFWLPILPGFLALRYLRRQQVL